jgi:hypothetical protein
MARRIKAVGVIVSGPDGGIEWVKVGEKTNDILVTQIKDYSAEYEDHVFSSYEALDESNQTVRSIVNCPVIVEYEEA